MKRYKFSIQARADLYGIRDYWSDFSESHAKRSIAAIQVQCHNLASHPKIGRLRGELKPGLRSFSVKDHVIFYVFNRHGITVARVIHGARDIQARDFA